jgi:hypothetical protein
MDFPIYGITPGLDLVKIIAKDEHIILSRKVDHEKYKLLDDDLEKKIAVVDGRQVGEFISITYNKFEGSSQFLIPYINGNLEEITAEEFETQLNILKDIIK